MVSEALRINSNVVDSVGLNPCFSGGWSRSLKTNTSSCQKRLSLNPCFSGGWSRSAKYETQKAATVKVLILVLVEDGLGGSAQGAVSSNVAQVLILVLVEDGLGALK